MTHTTKSTIKSYEDISIRLTKLFLAVLFIASMIALSVGKQLVRQIMFLRSPLLTGNIRFYALLICGYSLGIFAIVFIIQMFRLVERIGRGEVFSERNVSSLQRIGWIVAVASLIALFAGLTCYTPVLAISIAGVFMTLIIRVIRNAFGKAVQMKNELDYTI